MIRWRRPWKISLNLGQISKNPPVYGAWNVKKAVVGTGETLLDPYAVGLRSAFAYNR